MMHAQFIELFIYWNPDPIIFEFLGREIRWYGVMFGLGFLFAYLLCIHIFKQEEQYKSIPSEILIYIALGAVIGSRFGQVLFYNPEEFLENPLSILKIWEGGLASHGAVLGIALAVFIFKLKKKLSFFWLGDRLVASVCIAACFVRLGNLFNSEIPGKPLDATWAFVFEKIDALPRHPVQLYEAFAYLLIAFILYKILLLNKQKKGYTTGFFFILMFGFRFFIEFFKENLIPFDSMYILNIGQVLSLPLFFIGTILVYLRFNFNKHTQP